MGFYTQKLTFGKNLVSVGSIPKIEKDNLLKGAMIENGELIKRRKFEYGVHNSEVLLT